MFVHAKEAPGAVSQPLPDSVKRRQTNRRAALMEAAARQFLANGFAATSMRDIAAEAGMQPGSIYYHFPSKAELLVAVHEEGLRRITEATEAALEADAGAPPWERLEAACIAHLTVLLEGGDFFQALMRNVPLDSDPSRGHITGLRDRYEAIFTRLLQDLPLPDGTDRQDLRLMLLGAMNWSFTWYRPGRATPEELARTFVGFLRMALER
jgi:TetR/AcrR family transcriptional regulator, cholesterol catabolism regulator